MEEKLATHAKLYPSPEQALLLEEMIAHYKKIVQSLSDEMLQDRKATKKTSKDIDAPLPSSVRNQAIQEARGIFARCKKNDYSYTTTIQFTHLQLNNQSYRFEENHVFIPIYQEGKVQRMAIKGDFQFPRFQERLTHSLGTVQIQKQKKEWKLILTTTHAMEPKFTGKIMGIDLGVKIPAVAVTSDGKIRFFGNAKEQKTRSRINKVLINRLKEKGAHKKISEIIQRERRFRKEQDHQLSRAIVNFAIKENISLIRLENLTNIPVARVNYWSFNRLASFIEYKARLVGIEIEYVAPKNTSKMCPSCQKMNRPKDRLYTCSCGFTAHRDIVGAMNIRYAEERANKRIYQKTKKDQLA